jgi:hypothetical protein
MVKQSEFYKTGESQLFKIDNSDHNTYSHNPGQLSDVMIGFFEGTIKNVF